MCGHARKAKVHGEIMGIVNDLNRNDEQCTARELIQAMAEQAKGSEQLPKPTAISETPPDRPNVYSDGSVHNPSSLHWRVGGIGRR